MANLKKLVSAIKRNKSFLITSHANLEGDALGSELAFRELLLYLGKKAVIVNDDTVPPEYSFLPEVRTIKSPSQAKNLSFDAFVALDCSDMGRCRSVATLAHKAQTIINIDHHISNNNFGDINWVEPKASSAAEMIYRLYQKMRIPLNRNRALCLYVGILTDTGSFHYPNTNPESLAMAADLMHHGLEVNKIYRSIYENISLPDLKLLSTIICDMRSSLKGKVVWFKIQKSLLKGKKISIDLSEHILNFGRLAKEAQVVVLFKENLGVKSQVRINLRSKNVDVNKIAQIFGGGGHKNASGATVNGGLESVQQRVVAEIQKRIRD
jgi:phosphoesterase RecJ-like protein